MKCRLIDDQQYVSGRPGRRRSLTASYTTASWRYFYPRCNRILQALGICNPKAGAWVAATTVCSQKLF